MASWDHVHNLMVEVGECLNLAQVSEFAAEDTWHLVTRSGSVEVDFDAAGDRVVLTSLVGIPNADQREGLFQELLAFNGREADPRGIRAGFVPDAAEVVLLADVPAAGLEVPPLVALVERLSDATLRWRSRLATVDAVTRPAAASGAFAAGMIRG
jgi:hypothetical protein